MNEQKSKRKGLSMRGRERLAGYMFILPWMIGIVIFFFYNLFMAVQYGFNDIDMGSEGGYALVSRGWFHYKYALTEHPDFVRVLTESIQGIAWNVPLIIFFSLFIAIMLNRKFMLRGLVRVVFFLPVVMATDTITTAMNDVATIMAGGASSLPPGMEAQAQGVSMNFLIEALFQMGVPINIVNYVAEAVTRIYTVIRQSGVQILIFLAALQAIPPAMYEVSHIEGATSYEAFWKITLPLVSPLILTNVVYTIVDAYARSTIVTTARDVAFNEQNFGLSSAMSVLSSLAICLFLFIVSWLVSRKVFYQT